MKHPTKRLPVANRPRVSNHSQAAQSALEILADPSEELSDSMLMRNLIKPLSRQNLDWLFGELFNRYSERVTKWCYRVTKNEDWARDLTQEVFIRAFRSIHTFRGDAQLSTWLYVITRNHCLTVAKKWKSQSHYRNDESSLRLVPARADDVHVALEQVESYEHWLRFLNSILTPMEVRVIILHYVQDFTLSEITNRLMLRNRSGAKAYIVNARRKLNRAAQER